jgi:hypothetical protein
MWARLILVGVVSAYFVSVGGAVGDNGLNGANAFSSMLVAFPGGSFDPITMIGASGTPSMFPCSRIPNGSGPTATLPSGLSIANASRTAIALGPTEVSSRSTPNMTLFRNRNELRPIFQFARAKMPSNWIAKYIASGSPSTYTKFTLPGREANHPSISFAPSSGMILQEIRRRVCSVLSFASAVSLRSCSLCRVSSAIFSADFPASTLSLAISNAAFSLAKSQWCSFTFVVRTIANVARTPPIKQPSSTILANSPHHVAHSSEMSEKGHIRFPDWFFVPAIAFVVLAGVYSIYLQIRDMRRRRRSNILQSDSLRSDSNEGRQHEHC